jgi:hypothetical protein
MACIDVALGEVASGDLVVTGAGTTETALGTVPSGDDIRKADATDAALGGIGTTVDVQVAETAGDCLATFPDACGDWANCYQLKDYYDGLLTADALCEDSAEDPWTGGPMPVEWAYCEDNPPQMSWTDPSNAETSIDGKRTSSTGDDGAQVYWDGDPTFGYWGLFVFCSDTSDNPIDVWNGVRYTGANPDSGPFAYVTGSASDVAELEIEPCPA